MAGHECYHCKHWVEAGEPHDCWTTTERALTQDLPEDLRDAWERLREAASELGEQRIYASHHSIMFARKTCYFFVRPRRSALEVIVFLNRTVRSPQIRKAARGSGSDEDGQANDTWTGKFTSAKRSSSREKSSRSRR